MAFDRNNLPNNPFGKLFFSLILVKVINVGYRDMKPSFIIFISFTMPLVLLPHQSFKRQYFSQTQVFHFRQTKCMLHSDGHIVGIHPPTHMQTTESHMSTLRILYPTSKGLEQLFAGSRVQGPIFSRAAILVSGLLYKVICKTKASILT